MAQVQTITQTAGTTSDSAKVDRAYSFNLRCPSTNIDDVFVNLGGITSGAGDLRVRSGESLSVSIETEILAKIIQGILTERDFIYVYSFFSPTASQTLLVDWQEWKF